MTECKADAQEERAVSAEWSPFAAEPQAQLTNFLTHSLSPHLPSQSLQAHEVPLILIPSDSGSKHHQYVMPGPQPPEQVSPVISRSLQSDVSGLCSP